MTQPVSQIMHKNVISVSPDQTIQQAAALMNQYNIGALPVVENGALKGMITDRDITLRSTAKGNAGTTPVSACMSTSNIVTCSSDTDANQAATLMSQHQIRRLPVVDNNQMVGMISIGDLATRNEYQTEASRALTDISSPSKPQK